VRLLRLVSFACALLVTSCAPTLRRAPTGAWQEEGRGYAIAAAPNGQVMPDTWTLTNFTSDDSEFRKVTSDDGRDLAMMRKEDDGLLVVATENIAEDAREKKLEVLSDRWIQQVVIDSDPGAFEEIVPKAEPMSVTSGLRYAEVHDPNIRSAVLVHRTPFDVPRGAGVESEIDIVARGAAGPGRKLYLAIVRATGASQMVIVAYGNTPTMFSTGLADAQSLARRIVFP
jgi:hypothetical protein